MLVLALMRVLIGMPISTLSTIFIVGLKFYTKAAKTEEMMSFDTRKP